MKFYFGTFFAYRLDGSTDSRLQYDGSESSPSYFHVCQNALLCIPLPPRLESVFKLLTTRRLQHCQMFPGSLSSEHHGCPSLPLHESTLPVLRIRKDFLSEYSASSILVGRNVIYAIFRQI